MAKPRNKSPEEKSLEAYMETIIRIERDVAMIDAGAFYASAAISLRRIADALEKISSPPPPRVSMGPGTK